MVTVAFKMPGPTKLTKTGNYCLRERVPADLVSRAKDRKITFDIAGKPRTVTAGKTHVKVSLGTKDAGPARERYRAASAHLDRFWKALREGPRRLSQKEVFALAGEAYGLLAVAFDDNPGSPEQWAKVEGMNLLAEAGDYGRAALLIGDEARKAAAMEARFGAWADDVLRRKALVVDAESRVALVRALPSALRDANLLNMRKADGDYSPDPAAASFPEFPKQQEAAAPARDMLAITALFHTWALQKRGRSQSTVDQWRGYIEKFKAFVGHDDAERVVRANVADWRDSLITSGISGKTINDSHLASLRAVFNLAVADGRLPVSPADKVRVAVDRAAHRDMQGYSDAQATAILKAAERSKRDIVRWIPLLCAASGARVAEIAQLRKEDVREQAGMHVVRITGEAGSVKNRNSERTIPIHAEVIAAGFLDFVERRPSGPLFYDPSKRKADAKRLPGKIVAQNVREWINGLGIEGIGRQHRIDPNHAWRHRFETLAREANVSDSTAKLIMGHRHDPNGYGTVSLSAMKKALDAIGVPGKTGA